MIKALWGLLIGLLGLSAVQAQADVPQFREIAVFERGGVSIIGNLPERLAFSPDGSQLAAAGGENTVNVWDLTSGDVVLSLEHNSFAVSWSPDGRWIASGEVDGSVRQWDATSGQLYAAFDESAAEMGIYTSWSPDSTLFAIDSGEIIDAQNGSLVLQIRDEGEIPYGVVWSPDGLRIAIPTTGIVSALYVWSSYNGRLLNTFGGTLSASWSQYGGRIASEGQISDVTTGVPWALIPDLSGDIAWSPDGRWILSSRSKTSEAANTIFVWNGANGSLLSTLEISDCDDLRGLAWSADGTRAAATCFLSSDDARSEIHVWELEQ